jgi:hypothetical protein
MRQLAREVLGLSRHALCQRPEGQPGAVESLCNFSLASNLTLMKRQVYHQRLPSLCPRASGQCLPSTKPRPEFGHRLGENGRKTVQPVLGFPPHHSAGRIHHLNKI